MWQTLPFLAPVLPAQSDLTTSLLNSPLMPLVIMVVIFYLLVWRPAQQKQKAHQAMLDAIKKGDRVVTSGGLYGKVTKVDESIVVLEISDNTRVRVSRRAIAGFEGEADSAAEP